jgi:hypothetical protein
MSAFPNTNINLSNVNQSLGYLSPPFNFTNLRGRTLYDSQGNTITTPTSGPISFDNFKGQLYAVNTRMSYRTTNQLNQGSEYAPLPPNYPNYTDYDILRWSTSDSGAWALELANTSNIRIWQKVNNWDANNQAGIGIQIQFKADPESITQTRNINVTFQAVPRGNTALRGDIIGNQTYVRKNGSTVYTDTGMTKNDLVRNTSLNVSTNDFVQFFIWMNAKRTGSQSYYDIYINVTLIQ